MSGGSALNMSVDPVLNSSAAAGADPDGDPVLNMSVEPAGNDAVSLPPASPRSTRRLGSLLPEPGSAEVAAGSGVTGSAMAPHWPVSA